MRKFSNDELRNLKEKVHTYITMHWYNKTNQYSGDILSTFLNDNLDPLLDQLTNIGDDQSKLEDWKNQFQKIIDAFAVQCRCVGHSTITDCLLTVRDALVGLVLMVPFPLLLSESYRVWVSSFFHRPETNVSKGMRENVNFDNIKKLMERFEPSHGTPETKPDNKLSNANGASEIKPETPSSERIASMTSAVSNLMGKVCIGRGAVADLGPEVVAALNKH